MGIRRPGGRNAGSFHQDGDEATLRFHLKGGRVKTKGILLCGAEAIAEYVRAAGIESGPLFRPRSAPRSDELSEHGMTERTMNRLLMRYLQRLPGATTTQIYDKRRRAVKYSASHKMPI